MRHISTGTNNVQSGDLASAAKSTVTQAADDGAMSAADTSGIQHVRGERLCMPGEKQTQRRKKREETKERKMRVILEERDMKMKRKTEVLTDFQLYLLVSRNKEH